MAADETTTGGGIEVRSAGGGELAVPATGHRLTRDQVIWQFGPHLEPVLEVDPGDVVTFQTDDCFSGQPGSAARGHVAVGHTHAAMGDGEVGFTGVEIAGEVDIRFDILKDQQATWPVTELEPAQALRPLRRPSEGECDRDVQRDRMGDGWLASCCSGAAAGEPHHAANGARLVVIHVGEFTIRRSGGYPVETCRRRSSATLTGLLLGSVTHRLLHIAPCPRPRGTSGED